MLTGITEIKPGSYIGDVILQNGTKVYLAFSNNSKLRGKVYIQFKDSTDKIITILKKIKEIKQDSDVIEKKQNLFRKYEAYFKDEQQFEIFFDYFYNDLKKLNKVIIIARESSVTLETIFLRCKNTTELDSFAVVASTAPISLDDIDSSCPLLLCDRNIFMAMTVTMNSNILDSIAVNHYGIVRDPSSLLGLNAPTDNASMMLHSFAAYVSLKKYNKYLQVNNPVLAMRQIIDKSGIMIYNNKEELLADVFLPQNIRDYLEKVQDLHDLDYRKCGGNGLVAIKLFDLAKIYQSKCVLNQSQALLFADDQTDKFNKRKFSELSQISESSSLESQKNVSKQSKKLLL